MPHINRIRVNNVKYNFGTQSYEDFCLKPFGHNMLYDLANGGGKSVLMLLMLQTVLPNCSLDDKQPLEKLFRTGDGSQTIHSLVEWKLDVADVVNGFRYMTTGFCARKAQNAEEGQKETASIDYFNYCIFYRDYNANDICNLPLVKNKEKITYTGLRKYLKELARDPSLIVRLFDKKGEYQAFLADYGLYESEWEIIRGINKTEGHVRAYFETNYRTTRKVIEELLIEEIIQKSFVQKGGQDTDEIMSRTLLEMKDKLVELSKKKAEIGSYDRQMELLAQFVERVKALKDIYGRMEKLRKTVGELYGQATHMEKISKSRQEACEQELARKKDAALKLQERMDAAQYLGDCARAKHLEEKKKRLEDEVRAQEEAKKDAGQRLALKESANDYLEYQEEKRKRDGLAAEIAAMSCEKNALLDEVHFLTHHMKIEQERQKKELSRELSALEVRYHSLQIRIQGTNEQGNALAKEVAGGQVRAQQQTERLQYLDNSINTKKRQVGILLLEECGHKREECEEEKFSLEKEQEECEVKLGQAATELERTKKELLACEFKLSQLGQETVEETKFLAGYEEKRKQIEPLFAVYGTEDYQKLVDCIREREVLARIKSAELGEEIKARQEKLSRFFGGAASGFGFLEELPGAGQWKEYIHARHGMEVQTGKEYLEKYGKEEQEELLKEYPYLPYALVVEGELEKLWQDGRLHQGGDTPFLLLVKEAALRNRRPLLAGEDMKLCSKDFSSFFEEITAQKELERLQKQQEKAKEHMHMLFGQRKTYREDEQKIWDFWNSYEKKYRECEQEKKARDGEIASVNILLQELEKKAEELTGQVKHFRERMEHAEKRCKELSGEIALLAELEQEFGEAEELTGRKKETEETILKNLAKQQELVENGRKLAQEADEVFSRANAVRMKVEKLSFLWKEKYQKYDVPGEYGECALSGEALSAELSGKCQAYERGYSEADDKNRLMQSYVAAMERCLRAVDGRGVALLALKEMEAHNQLYITPEPELKKLRSEIEKMGQVLAQKQQKLAEATAQWNRMHGKTGQLAAELTKRYGSAPSLKIPEGEIEEYVENSRARLDALLREEEGCKGKLREAAQEAVLFCDLRKEIGRMMHSAGIPELEISSNFQAEESAQKLRERCKRAEEEYEETCAGQKKRQEEFSRDLQKLTEQFVLYHAASLADEIRKSVVLPENEQDAQQLVGNLYEVRDCLALEKSRVESGIEDIIGLKENFENQCLQRCINIKTELDRLPALSKITLGGEQIPIVSLQIPYVKEEFYQQRMSDYLDELVENVENFREQADRLAYIRGALSFKKLFAVIVTDMNAVRLSLYKRERMKEQSRHLRYEEAVGSTGQSQGIYIQFLIAVINYIANINSGRGENTGLGKVIFIDNPFGAAKDLYIWEPIFELLKTNQVQLIVPARGTTPAITGRFDVNYILGQKLIDGRQQTVVIDYHSSVHTEELEYIPLQFEQESFDFL